MTARLQASVPEVIMELPLIVMQEFERTAKSEVFILCFRHLQNIHIEKKTKPYRQMNIQNKT